MIEVHLIGYTSDLRHLVLDLDADDGHGRYRLVVDADLFLTVDELRDLRRRAGMDAGVPYTPDPARVESEPDSRASPTRGHRATHETAVEGPVAEQPSQDVSAARAETREPGRQTADDEHDGEPVGEPVGEPSGEPVPEQADEPAGEPVREPAAEAAGSDAGSEPPGERREAKRSGSSRPSGQGETVRVLGSDEVAEALSRQLEDFRSAPPPNRPPPPHDERRRDEHDLRSPPGLPPGTGSEGRGRAPYTPDDEEPPRGKLVDAAALLETDDEEATRRELVDAAALFDTDDVDDGPGDRDSTRSSPPIRDSGQDADQDSEQESGQDSGQDADQDAGQQSAQQSAQTPSPNGSTRPSAHESSPDAADSSLSPAEIQAHLRAGRSSAWVAKKAGTDVAWVERWLPPIVAERRQVLEEAQGMRVEVDEGLAADALVAAVTRRLEDRQVDPDSTTWRVKRRSDGRWSVNLRFEEDGRTRSATWTLDRDHGRLRPASELARDLGWAPTRR